MHHGTIHQVPDDFKKVLLADKKLLLVWDSLTPLARNEWICWITIVKKEETRQKHIQRLKSDLMEGKRRPCCWSGCSHHNKNAKKWLKLRKKDNIS